MKKGEIYEGKVTEVNFPNKGKLNVKWYGYCQECNSRTEYPFYD